MDEDVNMDAPQISTLREEDTPPPLRGSKSRVKLLVGDKKGKGKSSSPSVSAPAARKIIPPSQTQSQPQSEEEVDEEEEEEDQLIDDDEPALSVSAPPVSASTGTKRKAPPKKPARPRKTDKQDKEDKKPDEPRELPENEDGQSTSAVALPEKPPPKKKAAARKTATTSKPKIKVPPRGAKNLTVPPTDDAAMSETHTITAPSSPFPMSHGASPEPEEVEPPPPPPPLVPEQPGESIPLPLPVYPLPSKPFPVQPPAKIGTGFAPVQPLDRSGAKVRQWRIANREIRGIAGGRWFARSWVGDKESEFATAVTTATAAATAKLADADKVAIPKSVISTSAPALGKASKSKGARGSAGVSVAPSRSGSIVPELHTPKAPTKMRNIITGPALTSDEPETALPEPHSISMVS